MAKSRIGQILSKGTIAAATVVASGAAFTGLASASSLGGDGSWNDGFNNRFSNNQRTNVRNTNDIDIRNTTRQTAETGDVRVSRVLKVGDVSSGDATNVNEANFDVNASNDTSTGGGGGSWGNSWDGFSSSRFSSNNRQTTNVTNRNDIDITNNTRQTAETGDVSVSKVLKVGEVSSGDATNYNSADFNVTAENSTNTN
jgi:hypothetical protein